LSNRSTNFSADLVETANLKVSLNNSSPKKSDVVAADGSSDDELDNLTVLVFDIKAEKDDILITDLNVAVAKTGSGAATASTTVKLFDGSTELDATSMSLNTALFSDIDYIVPKDTTKTLTVKVDIRNANSTIANFVASASSTGITAENSIGDTVSGGNLTGSATGYSIGVRNAGAEVTLVSKSITTSGVAQTNGTPVSTSTLTATFNVKVKAVGGDVLMGTVASSTRPAFNASSSFRLYDGGVVSSVNNSTSTSFTIPTTCTLDSTNSCLLAEGSEVTIPVTFQIPGRAVTGAVVSGGLYAVGLESVLWHTDGVAQSSTFMSDEIDWRTSDVSFP